MYRAAGLANEPKSVAAKRIHVGIGDRDRRRHADHSLDRIAAIAKDCLASFGGKKVRGGNRSARETKRIIHRTPSHAGLRGTTRRVRARAPQ